MRRIRLSNLFHSVGAAKLKDRSKKMLEQFLLSGGITNYKSLLAERVFVKLLLALTIFSGQNYVIIMLQFLDIYDTLKKTYHGIIVTA